MDLVKYSNVLLNSFAFVYVIDFAVMQSLLYIQSKLVIMTVVCVRARHNSVSRVCVLCMHAT